MRDIQQIPSSTWSVIVAINQDHNARYVRLYTLHSVRLPIDMRASRSLAGAQLSVESVRHTRVVDNFFCNLRNET